MAKKWLKTKGEIHKDNITGYDFRKDEPLPLIKAVRQKCMECCNYRVKGTAKRIRECHIYDCTLWPYRLGKNPRAKKKTPAQIEAARRTIWKAREARKEPKATKESEQTPPSEG